LPAGALLRIPPPQRLSGHLFSARSGPVFLPACRSADNYFPFSGRIGPGSGAKTPAFVRRQLKKSRRRRGTGIFRFSDRRINPPPEYPY
ncbi:MAG: hypothetical protein LUH46_06755, partial [Alistipes sp.]|nr:hypothetical protein [Alistipes sp.]